MNDPFGLTEKHRELCDRLDALTLELRTFPRNEQQHSPAHREWERFTLIDGGVCAGGTVTVGTNDSNLVPAPNGWEAYVHSVAITVSGASAAGTVASYNGEVADQNLFDYANALVGNTPSRIVAFYEQDELYVQQADALSFVIAGAATTAGVIVRVTGKRRQV